MLGSPEIIQTHLEYHAWATRRLVDAAAQLSAGDLERDFHTSDRSVVGTLTHLYGADRVWLARVEGDGTVPFPERENLTTLRQEWPLLLNRWHALAAEQTQETLEAPISYLDRRGNPYTSPLWQIILQVVNHGSQHRGQVAGFLRAMGHTPPGTDLIFYYREKG